MVPRMISSWTYRQSVAREMIEFNMRRKTLPEKEACTGVIISRKIPAKHIVWDSTERKLVQETGEHHTISNATWFNLNNEFEVIVARLPQYQLIRNYIVWIQISVWGNEDVIRRLFNLPDYMLSSRYIILGKSEIKQLRVRS